MCRLVESIKVLDGGLINIGWHNLRLNEARGMAFGACDVLDLQDFIVIPTNLRAGVVYKCRVVYGLEVELVEFLPYVPRVVKVLQLVDGGDIDYHLKYEDRGALNALFAHRGGADDILIVKDGCITDTSYSNIAFFDGSCWYTPDTYLLNGTQRRRLLAEGVLAEARIGLADLYKYVAAKPINAMLDFGETPCVTISQL